MQWMCVGEVNNVYVGAVGGEYVVIVWGRE